MLMDSEFQVTAIDISIATLVLVSIFVFFKHKKILDRSKSKFGFGMLLAGLFFLGFVVAFELLVVVLLTLVQPRTEFLTGIAEFLLNYHWAGIVLAVAAIVTGFTSLTHRMSKLVGALNARSDELKAELERRSKSEAACRESERRFRRLYNETPVMLHSIGQDGRITNVNNHWLKTLGYERSEVIGRKSIEFMDEESRNVAVNIALPRFFATGEIREQPYRFVTKDGEVRDILLSGFAERDKDGTVIGSRAALIDVTQRNRAEADAMDARRVLSSAIEHISDGFAVFDGDDRLILCNDQFKALYPLIEDLVVPGAKASDLTTATLERGQIVDHSPCEAEPVPGDGRHDAPATARSAQILTSEGRWIEARDYLAENVGRVSIRIDITERKAAEDALKLRNRAMEASADGIMIADARAPDLPVVYANPAIEKITGYRVEELLGRNCRFLQGKETDQPELERIREALRERRPGEAVLRNFRKDGKLFLNECHIAPVTNGAGEVTHYVGIQKDVTERRQAEDQLRQVQKMEAVGQLTGGVAHDFNNLLAIIMGNAELLLQRIGDPDDLARTISRAASRGANLTRRLLAFSRRQSLEPRVIDVEDVIAGMSELLNPTLGETIILKTIQDRGLWQVMADPGGLESALLNLAINARDAMPEGGTLTVLSGNVELAEGDLPVNDEVGPGPYIKLTVRDTGTGMPDDVRQRAFEPFFTTKGVGEGSGLGLSMVYGFAKQTGGFVAIDSEEGVGTTVRLYLPRAEATEKAAREEAVPSSEIPDSSGKTILVVEDDKDVRDLIVLMLQDFGCAIHEAEDGKSALAQLNGADRIDLILTDIVLPGGMTGPELAKSAVRRFPAAKVLYMSGYAKVASHGKGPRNAEVHVLNKPFRKKQLTDRVAAILTEPADNSNSPMPIAL